MSHVDEGLLHAYIDGAFETDAPERAEIEAHLADCADCRVRLEDALRVRDDAQRVLGRLAPPPREAPSWSEIVEAHAAGTGAAPAAGSVSASPRRGARPFRQLAWAASLVLALGAGWMARAMFTAPGVMPSSPATMQEQAATMRATPRPVPETEAAADAIAEPPAAARAAAAEQAERQERPSSEAGGARETVAPGSAAGLAAPRAAPLADASAEARQKTADSSTVVTGRVTDEAGAPLANVQVAVAGTALGTLTDAAGRFRISSVPAGEHVVAAQLLGFETAAQRLAVAGDSTAVSFRLGASGIALDEIVVTADSQPVQRSRLRASVSAMTVVSALEAAVEEWETVGVDDAAAALGVAPVLPDDTAGITLELGEAGGVPVVRAAWVLDGSAIRFLQVRDDAPRAAELVPTGEREALQVLRGLRVLVRAPDPETLAEAVRRLR